MLPRPDSDASEPGRDARLESRLARLVTVFGIVATLAGLSSLLASTRDPAHFAPALQHLWPLTWPPGLGLTFAGFALLLVRSVPVPAELQAAAVAASAATLAIGAWLALQRLGHFDLSFVTPAALVSAGCALALLDRRTPAGQRPSTGLAIVTLALGLLALFHHLYEFADASSAEPSAPVSVVEACGFIALALGLLVARADAGPGPMLVRGTPRASSSAACCRSQSWRYR